MNNENENNGLKGHQDNLENTVIQVPAGTSDVSVTKSPAENVKGKVTFMHLFARDRRKVKKSGNSLMCCCPFHNDTTPSFSVFSEGKSAKCFGCGWYGDIFDYEKQAHKVGFKEALDRLQKVALKPPKYPDVWVPHKAECSAVISLTPEQLSLQIDASKRLAEDDELSEYIAGTRGWQQGTIHCLADEGSLGWHEGALVFNYATGMKLRAWPDYKFWWKFGNPTLWRSDQVTEDSRIMLCEGETDAITLLDIGMGDEYSIVALASATSVPFGLATMLEGRDVVLCMDDDEAGERAVARLIPLLLPSCSSVSTFVYKEVQP